MKKLTALTFLTLSFIRITGAAWSSKDLVEVMLVDKMDEPRGYCLDIAGGKGRDAPLDKGIQAHTCYNYTGKILEDQGFDPEEIKNGQFRIDYFNVCISADSISSGSGINLEQCNQSETQKFTLKPNGQLVIDANPDLCVTINHLEKKEGRGGSPVHVMRPLYLQKCSDEKEQYQTWTLNAQ